MPSATNNMNVNDLTRTFTKALEDMNTLMSSYVSAATKSNAAAWQGIEDLTRNMGGLVQDTVTRTISAYSTLASAKSPQEAAETHSDFLKDSFDSVIAGGSKLSEISMRTAQGAIEPLAQHTNETMGAVMKKAKSAA